MKLFGITGGIAMGKSTAGRLLSERGHPVIDTDDIARQIVEPGQPALQEIVLAFGLSLLDASGSLRRDELARIVFPDPNARQTLEAILHPRIREVWHREAAAWRLAGRPFGFVLIPLLFETNAAPEFDATICLACSEATQHQRLLARGWSPEHIGQRLAAQWPVQKKIEASRFVVWTDTTLEAHAEQLAHILAQF
ncbi:MAG: coaE [Verrucomicrobiales bacterium]|nr:coaE [Verrucomicrobiales bacterium]